MSSKGAVLVIRMPVRKSTRTNIKETSVSWAFEGRAWKARGETKAAGAPRALRQSCLSSIQSLLTKHGDKAKLFQETGEKSHLTMSAQIQANV